jgi:hypothetical protein
MSLSPNGCCPQANRCKVHDFAGEFIALLEFTIGTDRDPAEFPLV